MSKQVKFLERCVALNLQSGSLTDWLDRIEELERIVEFQKKAWTADCTERDELAAHVERLREALENCRLLAARHRKEEWATHILRFCESGGSVANPFRQDDSALQAAIAAEAERAARIIEAQDVDPSFKHRMADAIRATKDES